MTIQLEFWQLITLLLAFFGFAFTAGRLLLAQIDRRLEERFKAMEDARVSTGKHWDERFAALIKSNQEEAAGWQRLERDFLEFKASLPLQYTLREDSVRNQAVIEAKLDGLALRIENVQLKGNPHAR